MSFIDNHINKKIKENPKLEKQFEQADLDLNSTVKVRDASGGRDMIQK